MVLFGSTLGLLIMNGYRMDLLVIVLGEVQ